MPMRNVQGWKRGGGGGGRAEEECHGILKEDVSADQQERKFTYPNGKYEKERNLCQVAAS